MINHKFLAIAIMILAAIEIVWIRSTIQAYYQTEYYSSILIFVFCAGFLLLVQPLEKREKFKLRTMISKWILSLALIIVPIVYTIYN